MLIFRRRLIMLTENDLSKFLENLDKIKEIAEGEGYSAFKFFIPFLDKDKDKFNICAEHARPDFSGAFYVEDRIKKQYGLDIRIFTSDQLKQEELASAIDLSSTNQQAVRQLFQQYLSLQVQATTGIQNDPSSSPKTTGMFFQGTKSECVQVPVGQLNEMITFYTQNLKALISLLPLDQQKVAEDRVQKVIYHHESMSMVE